MTLVPFTPAVLDNLALHLHELASKVQRMAKTSRDNDIEGFMLHANKITEWMGHIDNWVLESNAKLAMTVEKQRGAQRGAKLPKAPTTAGRRPKKSKR